MKILLLLMAIGLFSSVKAQRNYDYPTDSLTYKQYLDSDWETLYATVKDAEKAGVDFYYLKLRAAFATFYTQRYEVSRHYFEAAERYQKGDDIVNEFHYLAALYAGQRLAQIERYALLSADAKRRLKDPNRKAVESVSLESGFNYNSNYKALQEVGIDEGYGVYGERILLKNLNYNALKLSHGMLPYLTLNHSFQLINLNKEQQFHALEGDGTTLIEKAYVISTQQLQYHVNAEINIKDKFYVTPSFTLVRYNSGSIKADYTADEKYEFSEKDNFNTQYLYGVSLMYKISRFQYTLRSNYFTDGILKHWQHGAAVKYYLSRSKNHYLLANFDMLKRTKTEWTDVWSLHYGFKLEKCWLELNHTSGEMRNYAANKGEIVYNTYEKITSKTGVSFSRPLFADNLWLSVYYNYLSYTSAFVFLDDELVLKKKDFTHHNHSLTGGLSWYF